VAYVAAVIKEPGVIRHTTMDHMIFGELDGARSPRLERLHAVCRNAGFQATLSDHIEVDIWSKFARLSVMAGMTAVTRAPVGAVVQDPDLFAMMQAAVLEAIAVARKKSIALPPGVFDEIIAMQLNLPPQTKSSMLEDLERGRRLELPWLSGAVVRIGTEVGVDTPIHRFIATVLKPHVNGN
jgi:2-dehydropantoate 2-reductase